MRILFLAPRFHTNQVDLVRKLQEEGHDVAFLVALTSQSEDHTRITPVVLSQTRLGDWINRRLNFHDDVATRAAYTLPPLQELWCHLETFKPDVVVVRYFASIWLLLTLPWLLVRRPRLVIYTQRPKFRAHLSLVKRAERFVLLTVLRARWFTPVNHYANETNATDVHPRIVFIPFFKYPDPRAKERTYRHPPRFLAVAKFTRRKNLAALLSAFARAADGIETHLTIVGENTRPAHSEVLTELAAFVETHGLSSRVHLLQNRPYHEVQSLYRESDVFMMCSYAEPASVSQVEAMAHGLAVICNRDNGTAHYVDDGETGILVDSSSDSIAAAMSRYLEDASLAERHGRAGFAKTCGPYSVEQSYRALMRVFGVA